MTLSVGKEGVSDCCGAKVSSRNIFTNSPMNVVREVGIEYVCSNCHTICNSTPVLSKPVIEPKGNTFTGVSVSTAYAKRIDKLKKVDDRKFIKSAKKWLKVVLKGLK